MNKEIAKIFYNIADYLKAREVEFKPYAYQKAATAISSLEEEVSDVYKKRGIKALQEIPGVGESIALKIEEYIKTGKIKEYEKINIPEKLFEITRVEGIGLKKAEVLHNRLGVDGLNKLERAAKTGKIASLPGFGEKTEKNILENIFFLKSEKGRILLSEAFIIAEKIKEKLSKLKEVEMISEAGSLRRRKETIGDIDIIVASKSPEKIMDFFTSLPGVVKIWGKGKTKSSVRMKEGIDVDLRIVPRESYGSAIQYFTGSKNHNIEIRKLALRKGLKINEYGVFEGKKKIAGETEEEVYAAIGFSVPPPETREGMIEETPPLITLKDIKGDLHCHSSWDGGKNSIEEMARGLNYEYIGISDHTKFLRIENGLDEKQLLAQGKEIRKLNKKGFKILHGCEANILRDGNIDISGKILKELDYIIAGVHSGLKSEKMTERIIKAVKNPFIDIISHPTGRLINQRPESKINMEKVLRAAKHYGTILEINASPERLDLKDLYIRRAKELGVKMIIGSDAHQKSQLNLMKFGVFQARRGRAEKEDIINTKKDITKCLKRHRLEP